MASSDVQWCGSKNRHERLFRHNLLFAGTAASSSVVRAFAVRRGVHIARNALVHCDVMYARSVGLHSSLRFLIAIASEIDRETAVGHLPHLHVDSFEQMPARAVFVEMRARGSRYVIAIR